MINTLRKDDVTILT